MKFHIEGIPVIIRFSSFLVENMYKLLQLIISLLICSSFLFVMILHSDIKNRYKYIINMI